MTHCDTFIFNNGRLSKFLFASFVIFILISFPSTLKAGTVTKANTFSSGSVISSSQVNTNFDTLYSEINLKETRLTTVESSAWTKSGANLYYNTGGVNVGIGVTTPSSLFSVADTFQVDSVGRIGIGQSPSSGSALSYTLNNASVNYGHNLSGITLNPSNASDAEFLLVSSNVAPPAGGTVTVASGVRVKDVKVTAVAGTVTELDGVKVDAFTANGAGSTVTNNYSGSFALPTNGSNNQIGVLIGAAPAGPITSSLYVTSGKVYMGGSLTVGTGTGTPTGTLTVSGNVATNVTTVSGAGVCNYTVTSTDSIVLVNNGCGAIININLPVVAGTTGRMYTFKQIDASGNSVKINGNGAETIDGAASQSLTAQYKYVTIISDGSAWYVVASN